MRINKKLCSKNELLVTLIKMRLGLKTVGLITRYVISEGFHANIFIPWLRAKAEYVQAFVYIHDIETILLPTTPERFSKFKNLTGVNECSKVFMETPKHLKLQSIFRFRVL